MRDQMQNGDKIIMSGFFFGQHKEQHDACETINEWPGRSMVKL